FSRDWSSDVCSSDLPLQTHGGGHGQYQPVTPSGGDESQTDAGVARGGLDYGHAGLEQATGFRVPDHVGADPALDRVGRIAPLDLGQNGDALGAEPVDANQGSITDGLGVARENMTH